jgi:hypothetical protein
MNEIDVSLSIDIRKYFAANATSSDTSANVSCGSWLSQEVTWYERIEPPIDDPMSFLVNKQRRIARQQIDQRNDRIKAWEDKRKRFK